MGNLHYVEWQTLTNVKKLYISLQNCGTPARSIHSEANCWQRLKITRFSRRRRRHCRLLRVIGSIFSERASIFPHKKEQVTLGNWRLCCAAREREIPGWKIGFPQIRRHKNSLRKRMGCGKRARGELELLSSLSPQSLTGILFKERASYFAWE